VEARRARGGALRVGAARLDLVPAGWTVHAKGGWGSRTGAIDHQVALLTRGHECVAAAVVTTSDGTHAYGKATLRGVFARLLRDLSATPGTVP